MPTTRVIPLVRAAVDDDADVAALLGEAIPWSSERAAAAVIRRCAAPSPGFVVVASAADGTPCGYLVVTTDDADPDAATLVDLHVALAARRTGIATALVTAAAAEARGRGATTLRAVVDPADPIATALARHLAAAVAPRLLATLSI